MTEGKNTGNWRSDDLVRLNKYLSNAGIASRREADVLIQSGAVKVNGEVVDQLGYKIKHGDKVTYGDRAVKSEKKCTCSLTSQRLHHHHGWPTRDVKQWWNWLKEHAAKGFTRLGAGSQHNRCFAVYQRRWHNQKLTTQSLELKRFIRLRWASRSEPKISRPLPKALNSRTAPSKPMIWLFVGEGRKRGRCWDT